MNDARRAAAEDLLDALAWIAEDALVMRRVPTYGPEAASDPGPDPEVTVLQGFYLPHRRLPEPGQALYRDLQGMSDLRFCDPRPGPHTPPEELVRFHRTVDQLLHWLVATYDLGPPPPSSGPSPTPAGRGARPDPKDDRRALLERIVRRHSGESPQAQTPYTQEELARELGWPQSRVSRRMAVMFHGGMEGYKNYCRSEKFGGFLRRLESGGAVAVGIAPGTDEDDD